MKTCMNVGDVVERYLNRLIKGASKVNVELTTKNLSTSVMGVIGVTTYISSEPVGICFATKEDSVAAMVDGELTSWREFKRSDDPESIELTIGEVVITMYFIE